MTIRRIQRDKLSQQLDRVIGESDKGRMVEIDGLCCHVQARTQLRCCQADSSIYRVFGDVKSRRFRDRNGPDNVARAAQFWR